MSTPIKVICHGDRELRRQLGVERNEHGHFSVSLRLQPPLKKLRDVPRAYFEALAFSVVTPLEVAQEKIRIRFYESGPILWIESTMFQLLPQEAEDLLKAFDELKDPRQRPADGLTDPCSPPSLGATSP